MRYAFIILLNIECSDMVAHHDNLSASGSIFLLIDVPNLCPKKLMVITGQHHKLMGSGDKRGLCQF